MSLVDTTTGEVVDEVVPALTYDEARALTDEINNDTLQASIKVAQAWQGQAWKPLGYKSWEDYADAELPLLGSNQANRHVLLVSLRNVGMSTRAIAAVTGLHHSTIARGVANATPEVTGVDGKTYPSKITRRESVSETVEYETPHGEGVDGDDTGSDGEIGGPELPESELSPEISTPPETVGLTGETVEQTEPQSSAPVSPTRRLVTVHDFLEPVKSSWLTGVDPAVFWGLNNPDMADTFLMWVDSMTAYGQQLRAAQPNHLRLVGGTE